MHDRIATRSTLAFSQCPDMSSPTPCLSFAPRPWDGPASFVDLHRKMNRAFDNLFFDGSAWVTSPLACPQTASSTTAEGPR